MIARAEAQAHGQGRRRRARQMLAGAVVVAVVFAVLGVIGNRDADHRAARQRDRMTLALAHLSFGDAMLAPTDGVLSQVDAQVGDGGVNWNGANGAEFSQTVGGWWFWAPRCVVGVVTTAGATVSVTSGSQCPPSGSHGSPPSSSGPVGP